MKRRFEDSSPIAESPNSGSGTPSADVSDGEGSSSGSKNGGVVFGTKDFTPEEHGSMQRLLEQKIPVDYLTTRQGCGRGRFTYIESWRAIEIANSIFGFDGWTSRIIEMTPDYMEEVNGRFSVGVSAIVRVTLRNGASQEDVGFGTGENRNRGAAIESAKKEAITDARKRALRLFGNALGNSIYDREYIETLNVPQHKQASAPIRYDEMHKSSQDAFQSPTLMTPGFLPRKQPRASLPVISKASNDPSPLVEAKQPLQIKQNPIVPVVKPSSPEKSVPVTPLRRPPTAIVSPVRVQSAIVQPQRKVLSPPKIITTSQQTKNSV